MCDSFQLSVRGKNKKEKLGGFFKIITKSADEVLLSSQKVSCSSYFFYNISILMEWKRWNYAYTRKTKM